MNSEPEEKQESFVPTLLWSQKRELMPEDGLEDCRSELVSFKALPLPRPEESESGTEDASAIVSKLLAGYSPKLFIPGGF